MPYDLAEALSLAWRRLGQPHLSRPFHQFDHIAHIEFTHYVTAVVLDSPHRAPEQLGYLFVALA